MLMVRSASFRSRPGRRAPSRFIEERAPYSLVELWDSRPMWQGVEEHFSSHVCTEVGDDAIVGVLDWEAVHSIVAAGILQVRADPPTQVRDLNVLHDGIVRDPTGLVRIGHEHDSAHFRRFAHGHKSVAQHSSLPIVRVVRAYHDDLAVPQGLVLVELPHNEGPILEHHATEGTGFCARGRFPALTVVDQVDGVFAAPLVDSIPTNRRRISLVQLHNVREVRIAPLQLCVETPHDARPAIMPVLDGALPVRVPLEQLQSKPHLKQRSRC
mmetsp:Transcript_111362/g.237918  ORF Transcript_111362/g.237918 Transcript_111362/m.237918 type:complete len:269 (-) Transcript_111362:43-849(-)